MRLLEIIHQNHICGGTEGSELMKNQELPKLAKSPELLDSVDKLPDKIYADDPKIDQLVFDLSRLNITPINSPVPLDYIDREILKRTVKVRSIDVYKSQWSELTAIPNSDIPLPVDLFVSAPMITDWRRGRGSDIKGRQKSSNIVRQYAAMNARTQPAVQHVDLVIDSGGGIFSVLQVDGAHRLCAAKVRGDKDILCRYVNIVTLR